jgi:hypothetical protein
LLLDKHFSPDGRLIDAWAWMKKLQPRAPPEPPDGSGGGGGEEHCEAH